MQKSTIVLGFGCALLTAALGTSLSILNHFGSQNITQTQIAGTTLDIGLPNTKPPALQKTASASAVLWDLDADIMLHEENGFASRSIASLTKLMTAMVAIDLGIDWEKSVAILPEENVIGGNITTAPTETLTMRDLFHASLMGSANNATLALIRGLDIPAEEFIQAMNRKAVVLSLEQTRFFDVTGLDPRNKSTAYETARMAEEAFTNYPDIATATSQEKHEHQFGVSNRQHTIVNTNNLIVDDKYDLAGSKTGYLNEAGFCLAVRGTNKQASRIAVVLGAQSEWDSMNDIKTLLEMDYRN